MTVLTSDLADDVWALIDAVANVNTYRGEILDADGQPVDPPLDPDKRSHPYAVVYFGAGQHTRGRLGGTASRLPWTFQVSCVGGDDNRALWAADQVRAALTNTHVGGALLVETTDSGPMQRNDNVQPSRTVVHLMYRATVPG